MSWQRGKSSGGWSASRIGGFTLVELLVVIGIIGLLISILLPALSAAREQGRTIQCLSNLRSISQAATMYSSRFKGFTVPGYRDATATTNGVAADAENYATMLVNENLIDAPRTANVTDGVISAPSVFKCPDGTDDLDVTQFANASGAAPYPNDRKDGVLLRPWRCKSKGTGIVLDTWYGINATLSDFKNILAPCRRIPDDSNVKDFTLPKVTQMPDATRMVFLYDGAFLNPHYDGDRIHARHGKNRYTNIAFFDGHAATFPTEGLPGGMGPNASGTDVFSKTALGTNTTLTWRMNQR